MVATAEQRLGDKIDALAETTSKVLDDHETRLRVAEGYQRGAVASAATEKRFFDFGKWIISTVIAVVGTVAMLLGPLHSLLENHP